MRSALLILVGLSGWIVPLTLGKERAVEIAQRISTQISGGDTSKCPVACYGVYDKDDPNKGASCESNAEFFKSQGTPYYDPNYTWDDYLKECKKARESICGACVKHMHIRNPLSICLIILLLLIIAGGIGVAVMYTQGMGPFKKRQANVYNPNTQAADPQMSTQGNANQNYYGPGQAPPPSQSPTQNFSQ